VKHCGHFRFAAREPPAADVRIGVVLSGGGLRGAAHIGVLEQLVRHEVPIDVIVGSSAGAVVAAYYAAVGLTVEELMADATRFRGRHLLAHILNVRLGRRFDRLLAPLSGIIPTRLDQLERAMFQRLHHGVRGIGVVCHDMTSGQPRGFATGSHAGAGLSEVVKASASIPYLLAPVPVACDDELLLLTDGGVSDCLPVGFAQRPPLSATHLIVSDCRWFCGPPPAGDQLVYLRPRIPTTGTLWSPSSLLAAVEQGAAAVTGEVVERVCAWVGARSQARRAAVRPPA